MVALVVQVSVTDLVHVLSSPLNPGCFTINDKQELSDFVACAYS